MGNFLCVLRVAFTSAKSLANSQMTDMFTSGLQSHTSITFSNSIELIVFPDAWQLTGGVNKPGGGQITIPNYFKQLYFIRDFIIGI